MDETHGRELADRFRRASSRGEVEELGGPDARDFVFVGDATARPVLIGSFRIAVSGLKPFFVSIVCGATNRQNFQLFVMEKRKGSPTLGTSRYDGEKLSWRYRATKQSGDNAKRNAEFVRLAGTDSIELPLPTDDIRPFAEQVVRALELRREADAAGGESDAPDELSDDEESANSRAYWKIAPGEGGGEWPACRDGQYIAVAWKELGDVSGMNEHEFDQRAQEMTAKYDWGPGVSQVWKFRNIQPGDKIVANAGTKRVLGIGTVTGSYQFVPGAKFPHRLPVRWDDTVERAVDMPGWKRTLIRLTEDAFSSLSESAPTSIGAKEAVATVAAPSGGIDFDGVVAHLESRSLSFPAELLARYLLALQARRFVLLTGISGTGKTQLAVEVARLFSPRATITAKSGAVEIVIGNDMLKRGRFVVPASLAKEFDVLYDETRRLDVSLIGRPGESMAVYKDPERPNLLIVLLSGGCRQTFQTSFSPGDRLTLRREAMGGKEVLVAERATHAPVAIQAYELIAVRPDWTDSRALLGFYNPLTRSYVSTPTLDLLLRANEEVSRASGEGRAATPFFLIFDEMNLARVEHYFSDFLSAMESGEELALHDDDEVDEVIPRRLGLPSNLFVVGTVNIDETTYMFSPKVLDRAFVLEFNDVDLDLLAGKAPSEDPASTPLALTKLSGGLKLLGRATDAEWLTFEALDSGVLRRRLGDIHAAMVDHNRHFGYRVAREIARFVALAAEQTAASSLALNAAFDVAVLAKVLPKLNGTQAELDGTLRSLFRVALGDVPESLQEPDQWSVVQGELVSVDHHVPALPRTAIKLWRMQRKLRAQGFVSFIE